MRTNRASLAWPIASLILLGGALPGRAANPSMSDDFTQIMGWLSHEFAQGIAFNAGSTFDPPEEVKGYRIQPDVSLGLGVMPFDKGKFPTPQTKALRDMNPASIFPSKSMFPNLTMHLRAGLPWWRSDAAMRFTDMTTPPNYQISPGVGARAQSNSVGFAVRKHLFDGDELPLVTVGANYNYVFGYVKYNTKFKINQVEGFAAESDVNGTIQWNVSSLGLNAVMSGTLGLWTPFFGAGYNYATGSVRARLEVLSNTPLISPILGEASSKPEADSARLIGGAQWNPSWVNFFANGEIKAAGSHAWQSWIVHAGVLLPFRIGPRGASSARMASSSAASSGDDVGSAAVSAASGPAAPSEPERRRKSKPKKRRDAVQPYVPPAEDQAPELIFIQ